MGRKKDTKARWEAKWRKQWNEKEKIMRENNMPDSVIEDLRTFEWAQFNSDRRFYDNSSSWDRAYLEDLPEKPKMKPPGSSGSGLVFWYQYNSYGQSCISALTTPLAFIML